MVEAVPSTRFATTRVFVPGVHSGSPPALLVRRNQQGCVSCIPGVAGVRGLGDVVASPIHICLKPLVAVEHFFFRIIVRNRQCRQAGVPHCAVRGLHGHFAPAAVLRPM